MNIYSLTDFNTISKNSEIKKLNQTTLILIENFTKKVTSSSYRKTPIFKKKRFENKTTKNNFTSKKFKKTKLISNTNEEFDEDKINENKIRNLLNKLTNKNYEQITSEIILNIKHYVYLNDKIVLHTLCREIFKISSVNKFWSEIYCNFFVDLIENFPIMKEICLENFNVFSKIFNEINIVDEEDYDNFCKVNKENEQRRTLTNFYTNLYKKDIISEKQIYDLLKLLLSKSQMKIEEKNKDVVNEIFENIYIIITNLESDIVNQYDNGDDTITSLLIELYNNIKVNKISKKIEFKLIDYFDDNDIEFSDD